MAFKGVFALFAVMAFVICVNAANDAQFSALLGNNVNPSLTTGRWGFSTLTLFQGSHTYAGYLFYNGPSRASQITFTWKNSPLQSFVRNFQISIPSSTALRGVNVHFFTFNATLAPEITTAIFNKEVQVFVAFNSSLNISANYSTADNTYIALLNESLAIPPLSAGNKTGAIGVGIFKTFPVGSVIVDPSFPNLQGGGTYKLPRTNETTSQYFITGRLLNNLPKSTKAEIFLPATRQTLPPISLTRESTNFTTNQRNWVLSSFSNSAVESVLANGRAYVALDKQGVGQAIRGAVVPLTRRQGAKYGITGGKVTLGRTGNNWGSTWIRDSAAGSNVPANYLALTPVAGPGTGAGFKARSLISQVFFKIPSNAQGDSQLGSPWPLNSIAAIRINFNLRYVSVPDRSVLTSGGAYLFSFVPQRPNITTVTTYTFDGFNTTVKGDQRWFAGFLESSGSDFAPYLTADRRLILKIEYYPGTVGAGTPAPVLGIDEATIQLTKINGNAISNLRALGLLPSVASLQPK